MTYTSSEFAGKYEIRAMSESAKPTADTITVGIGLVPVATGTHFGLVGSTAVHPSAHFATPAMWDLLAAVADEFYDETGIALNFNDSSLPLVGRFEVTDSAHVNVAWDNPAHCDHRWGRGTDVQTKPFQVGFTTKRPSPAVKRLQQTWFEHSGFATPKESYFWEGSHLHVKTRH